MSLLAVVIYCLRLPDFALFGIPQWTPAGRCRAQGIKRTQKHAAGPEKRCELCGVADNHECTGHMARRGRSVGSYPFRARSFAGCGHLDVPRERRGRRRRGQRGNSRRCVPWRRRARLAAEVLHRRGAHGHGGAPGHGSAKARTACACVPRCGGQRRQRPACATLPRRPYVVCVAASGRERSWIRANQLL